MKIMSTQEIAEIQQQLAALRTRYDDVKFGVRIAEFGAKAALFAEAIELRKQAAKAALGEDYCWHRDTLDALNDAIHAAGWSTLELSDCRRACKKDGEW